MNSITQELQAVKPAAKAGRTALNFWIDLATALLFALLLGTSFLMKFILPPGTCDEDKVKQWLGHTRHWWGDIHFWAAVLLIVLIVVHIWLHWDWVVKIWGKLLGGLKSPVSWAPLIVMAGLLALPFVIPAQYLEIPAATEAQAAASGDGEPAQVAPCGVEGLSCSDCPASADRLFGGGCTGEEADEEAEGADDGVADGKAADEAGDAADAESGGEGCSDESDCGSCPSAGTGQCPKELFGDIGGDDA